MKPMGRYRFVLAGGPKLLYATKPYFGRRDVGLISVRRVVTQILVWSLGELAWINVDPSGLANVGKPALRAPEEAWCELAECLKDMADKLLD